MGGSLTPIRNSPLILRTGLWGDFYFLPQPFTVPKETTVGHSLLLSTIINSPVGGYSTHPQFYTPVLIPTHSHRSTYP